MSKTLTVLPDAPAAVLALVLAAAGLAFASLPAQAAEVAPTAGEVEAARRCAIDTRLAGDAFGSVRDSVRAGGGARAEALLSVAEDALLDARASCRDNAEVSAQLERLAGEAEGLRRSLGASR
ncbi:MAG: hypothetical protein ABR538_06600 [Candidatus Binatia bacterium]